MTSIRSFTIPTIMKHGLGAISALGDEAKALGMQRPLLVTDPGIVRAGLLDRATAPLKAATLDYVVFDRVAPNPPIALVDESALLYRSERCDGVIGFGGGSSMDVAKSIGVVASNGGSILDYEWNDPQPIRQRIPPTICVPTTAGTGSEVTLWAVITDPKRKIKFNVGGTALIGAWLALIDPELTFDLPAGGVHDVPHGALTARLLGPVMEYNYLGEPQKFARIAQALGEDTHGLSVWQAAERAVEAVYRLTQDVEIPSLQELGFGEDEIPMLAEIAYKDPQTIGNPRDLSMQSYVKIYQRAFDLGK